jgi:hypothetical protein
MFDRTTGKCGGSVLIRYEKEEAYPHNGIEGVDDIQERLVGFW